MKLPGWSHNRVWRRGRDSSSCGPASRGSDAIVGLAAFRWPIRTPKQRDFAIRSRAVRQVEVDPALCFEKFLEASTTYWFSARALRAHNCGHAKNSRGRRSLYGGVGKPNPAFPAGVHCGGESDIQARGAFDVQLAPAQCLCCAPPASCGDARPRLALPWPGTSWDQGAIHDY